LQRFSTGASRRGGSVFYYLPVFLAGFLPWSFFLIFAGWKRIKRWKELREEINKPVLFLLAWAAFIFVFFTISRSKLPGYVLPATVPLSILMAQAWEEVESAFSRRLNWLTAGFGALIASGLLVAIAAYSMFQFPSIQARAAEKLDPTTLAMIKPTLLYTGLILAALGILGRNLAQHAQGRALAQLTLAVLALTTPALILRWYPALGTYAANSSSRRLAQSIQGSAERDFPVFGFYYFRTGLPFYLQRPVGLVSSDGGQMTSNYVAMQFSKFHRDAGPEISSSPVPAAGVAPPPFNGLLIDSADFQSRMRNSTQAGLILVRNNQVQSLIEAVPDDSSVLGRWSEWQDSVWEVKKRSMKDE